MKLETKGFGTITIDGTTYDHDVVIDGGRVRKRDKSPSKPYRPDYGHTPLSVAEEIPWGGDRLVIGTGYDGRLPVMDEVFDEADRRRIEVLAVPTDDACRLIEAMDDDSIRAVLHTTC